MSMKRLDKFDREILRENASKMPDGNRIFLYYASPKIKRWFENNIEVKGKRIQLKDEDTRGRKRRYDILAFNTKTLAKLTSLNYFIRDYLGVNPTKMSPKLLTKIAMKYLAIHYKSALDYAICLKTLG